MSNRRSARDRGDPERRAALATQIAADTYDQLVDMREGQVYPVGPSGRHDDETIEDALWRSGGKRSIAAMWLGISRRNLLERINESERLQEIIEDINETRLDRSEIQLDGLIEAGCDKAVIFHLKTQGKARGWGESKQITKTVSFTLDAAKELQKQFAKPFSAIRDEALKGSMLLEHDEILVTHEPQPQEPAPAMAAEAPSEDDDELNRAADFS